MNITPYKTKPVVAGDNIFSILDSAFGTLNEKSVVAVTSKVVSLCENRVLKINETNKDDIVKQEADFYLEEKNKFNFYLTIKDTIITPSSGIDESNGNGYYVLWPKDPFTSANRLRKYLMKKHSLSNLGVIIVDSNVTPLKWGVTGVAIAYSGFRALNSYIGKKDLFGRPFAVEKTNVADGLAAAAVLVMGEGSEQTPLTVIEDVPFVKFTKKNPSKKELAQRSISIEDDLYNQLLQSVKWKKGRS